MDHLEYLVSLRGGAEAASEARKLADAVAGVGGKMRQVGVHSSQAEPGVSRFEKSLRRTAFALGAVGAGYAAWDAAKKAIEFTHNLAESTSTLSKTTGMSTEKSSQWVGVANALGVSGQSVVTTFGRLSTAAHQQALAGSAATAGHKKQSAALQALELSQHQAMQIAEIHASHQRNQGAAEEKLAAMRLRDSEALAAAQKKESEGSSEAASAFHDLGISAKFVNEHQNDTGVIMETVLNRLDAMHGSVDKGAVMTKLFGRSWQDLSPLLLEGAGGLHKLLGKAHEFHVELGTGSEKNMAEYHDKLIETKLAQEGLQIGFTELAAGPLMELMTGFTDLAKAIRTGDWKQAEKDFDKLVGQLVRVVEVAVPKMVEAAVHAGPKIIAGLWRGFEGASPEGKAGMVGLLLFKMGLVGAAGSALFAGAGRLAGFAWTAAFTSTAGTAIGVAALTVWAKGGAAVAALSKGAAVAGKAAGIAFEIAFVAGLAFLAFEAGKQLGEHLHFGFHPLNILKGESPVSITWSNPGAGAAKQKAQNRAIEKRGWDVGGIGRVDKRFQYLEPSSGAMPKGALGGQIMRGGLAEVGERGPEVVSMPTGAMVKPLEQGSWAQGDIVIQVDGRELARVNRRQSLMAQASGAGAG